MADDELAALTAEGVDEGVKFQVSWGLVRERVFTLDRCKDLETFHAFLADWQYKTVDLEYLGDGLRDDHWDSPAERCFGMEGNWIVSRVPIFENSECDVGDYYFEDVNHNAERVPG